MSVENQPNKSPIESAQFKGLTCASKTKENQWRMGSNINKLDQSRYKRKSRWHQKKYANPVGEREKLNGRRSRSLHANNSFALLFLCPQKLNYFFWQERGWEKLKKIIPETVLVKSHRRKSLVIDTKKKIIVRPQAGAIIGRGQTHTQKTFATTTTTTTAREGDEERDTISSEDVSKKIGFSCHRQYKKKKWESKEKGHSCVL